MKIGVVGKGGTGKTTVSSLICRAYAGQGRRVLAIDTDSNPNLALSLGLDEETVANAPLVPRSLAIGVGRGLSADDLMTRYGLRTPCGVVLLHAMRVDQAGAGCTCGNHAAVRGLLASAMDEGADVTVVDMEAGLEHLSRSGGTLAHADVLLVVMEPTRKSILTAARTQALAFELGIPRVLGVANKAHLPVDETFFRAVAAEYEVPLAGVLPFDAGVVRADRHGSVAEIDDALAAAIDEVLDRVQSPDEQRQALLAERDRIRRRLAAIDAPVG